jgi:hypothetical protein
MISAETLAWLREIGGRHPILSLPEPRLPGPEFWEAVEERRRRDEESKWRDERATERLWAWLERVGLEPEKRKKGGRG